MSYTPVRLYLQDDFQVHLNLRCIFNIKLAIDLCKARSASTGKTISKSLHDIVIVSCELVLIQIFSVWMHGNTGISLQKILDPMSIF